MTAPPPPLRCQHCPNVYAFPTEAHPSEDAARAARWRVWDGATLTGQHRRVVICPACTGDAADEHTRPGWDARCLTCGDHASDELPEALTEDEADQWRDEHECEPYVVLEPPQNATVEP